MGNQVLGEVSESHDNVSHVVRELRQSWDNRLVLPLTKLPERYVRGDLGIVLEGIADSRKVGRGIFSPLIQHDLSGKVAGIVNTEDALESTITSSRCLSNLSML